MSIEPNWHTESRSYTVTQQMLREAIGLPAGWDIVYAKVDTTTSYSHPDNRRVDLRFESKLRES